MIHFLTEYGLFLLKLVTVAIIIIVVFASVVSIAGKNKSKKKGKLTIKKINDKFEEYTEIIQEEAFSKSELKQIQKDKKKSDKQKEKDETVSPRLFVLDFDGDIKASATSSFTEEITAILLTATSNDEVLLRLESGGGLVNAYGLAASQLQRLKDAKIKLTIAVDKVAASGGYMMACVADKIIAAPFAIIGSIGVVAQLPNFHRLLEKSNIDFEQITAGQYKRTLTMFGENTAKGRDKMQLEVNDIHELFKDYIRDHRPVDLEKVATGEHWFGKRALELNLVDELKTSEDYILAAYKSYDIFEIQYKLKKNMAQRLSLGIHNALYKLTSPFNSIADA